MEYSFPQKLKELRKAKGLTMEELGREIGRTKSTISRWEKGERTPKMLEMVLLENVFGISAKELFYGVREDSFSKNKEIISKIIQTSEQLKEPRQEKVLTYAESQLTEQNKIIELPTKTYIVEEETAEYIYYDEAVSAGTGNYLQDSYESYVDLPVSVVPGNTDFVLSVQGDSMEDEYYDGDYIFIESTVNVENGEVGVFILNGDAYVKQLLRDENRASLHSFNPKYEDIQIQEHDEMRTIGRVLGRYSEK